MDRNLREQRDGESWFPTRDATMTVDDWLPLFEVSTRALASGAIEAGRWASDCLLSREDVPADVRRQARAQQLVYAQRLADIVPSTRLRRVTVHTPKRWSTFNPSIAATATGYVMVARSSNYVTDGLAYTIVDGDESIRTVNHLLSLDQELNVLRVKTLLDEVTNRQAYPCPATGVEDCRIFRYRGDWHMVANAREYNPAGIWQTLIARIEGRSFRDLVLLSDSTLAIHEKNWMPIVAQDELHFIYSCRPTVILKYDYSNRNVVEWATRRGPAIGGDFRGSSQVVWLGLTALFVVHEQIKDAVGRLFYLHRFVLMDEDFNIAKISPQFYFIEVTIEFCAGLAVRGNQLVLSFGYRDRAAYLATMRLDDVLATLRPV